MKHYAPHTAKAIDGISVIEAAKKLDMHPETIRRLIREKRILAERSLNQPGHGYVIQPSEIERIKVKGIDFTCTVA